MVDSTVLSVRTGKPIKKRLARLARATRRSQSFLAAEAIEEFVDVQEWQVAGLEKALASLDRCAGVPHANVKAWAASLYTDVGSANHPGLWLSKTGPHFVDFEHCDRAPPRRESQDETMRRLGEA